MSEPREPRSGDVYVRASGKLDDGVMETAPNMEWSESCAADPNYRFVCNRGEVLLLLRDNPAVVEMLDAIREGRVFLLEVGEGEEARQVIGLPKRFSFRYLMAESSDGRELEADGTLPPEWSVRAFPMGAKGDWKAHDDNDFPTAVRAALESEGE